MDFLCSSWAIRGSGACLLLVCLQLTIMSHKERVFIRRQRWSIDILFSAQPKYLVICESMFII